MELWYCIGVCVWQEMLKYTQNEPGVPELQEAMESMLSLLKYVNDIMHQIAIIGYQVRTLLHMTGPGVL